MIKVNITKFHNANKRLWQPKTVFKVPDKDYARATNFRTLTKITEYFLADFKLKKALIFYNFK